MEQTQQSYPPFAFSIFKRHDGLGSIAYKILGSKKAQPATPLVLVHGLSAVGLVDWSPLAHKLAEERQVLVFDNRDIGHSALPSDKRDAPYTVHDMANDVVELVKHVGWSEIDLLGFSMGGMIAQTLLVLKDRPFKIKHAILAATSAKPAHSDLLQSIPSGDSRSETLEAKIELVRPFIYIGYDPAYVQNPKNAGLLDRRIQESVRTRRPARTVQNQVGVIAGYDVRKQLSSISTSTPVLVFHGTLDRSVYFTEHKYIAAGVKHATVVKFDGMGHMWYDYYSTDYWATFLGAFLADRDVSTIKPPKPARL